MDQYTVIGTLKIDGVAPGGVVELDPVATNIEALIAAGHVELAAPAAPAEPAAKKKG
jgi:hypothetical protein